MRIYACRVGERVGGRYEFARTVPFLETEDGGDGEVAAALDLNVQQMIVESEAQQGRIEVLKYPRASEAGGVARVALEWAQSKTPDAFFNGWEVVLTRNYRGGRAR